MNKINILFFFLFIPFPIFSQVIELKGVYAGGNLYVMNPSAGDSYCVSAVYVNDSLSLDEILSNAFEIDFNLMKIDSGSALNIKILHDKACVPSVLNPDVISPVNNFSFSSFKVNRNGMATIVISGDRGPEPLRVEQFRWGKWVNVADVSDPDIGKPNTYSVELKFHSGENQFRTTRTSESGIETHSRIVKFRSQVKEITLASSKVADYLRFSDETMYEIFEERGSFIRDGYGNEADVSDLPKGKYWVNFDNKTLTFTKR